MWCANVESTWVFAHLCFQHSLDSKQRRECRITNIIKYYNIITIYSLIKRYYGSNPWIFLVEKPA